MYITHTNDGNVHYKQRWWCTLFTPHRGGLYILHTRHIVLCTVHYTFNIEESGVHTPHKKGCKHYTIHTDVHMSHTEGIGIDYTPYRGGGIYYMLQQEDVGVHCTPHTEEADVFNTSYRR